jgi:hypothetical protein
MTEKFAPILRTIGIRRLSLTPVRIGSEVYVGYSKGTIVRIFGGLTKNSKLADVCMLRNSGSNCRQCEIFESCEFPVE